MASTYDDGKGGKPRDQRFKGKAGFRERSYLSDGDSDSEDSGFAFRALRPEEVKSIKVGDGIFAQNPSATHSSDIAIKQGSRIKTQHIPLTRSKKVAAAWSLSAGGSACFVKIRLKGLTPVDFTGDAGDGLESQTRNMARSSQEVHVKGTIPPDNIIGRFRVSTVPPGYSYFSLKTDSELLGRGESFVKTKAGTKDPHVAIRITKGFDEPPPLPERCLISPEIASDLKVADEETKREEELGELESPPRTSIPGFDLLEALKPSSSVLPSVPPPGPAFLLTSPISSPDQYDDWGAVQYAPKGTTASYGGPLPEAPKLPEYLPMGRPTGYSPFPIKFYTPERSSHPSSSLQALTSSSTVSQSTPSPAKSDAETQPPAKKPPSATL
jgi:hypothetical protein